MKRKHIWLLHKPETDSRPRGDARANTGRGANSGRRASPARGSKRADRAVHRIEEESNDGTHETKSALAMALANGAGTG